MTAQDDALMLKHPMTKKLHVSPDSTSINSSKMDLASSHDIGLLKIVLF